MALPATIAVVASPTLSVAVVEIDGRLEVEFRVPPVDMDSEAPLILSCRAKALAVVSTDAPFPWLVDERLVTVGRGVCNA